jgi:hypothetical protein
MKQPRRWAVLLTVLVMAASLVFAPRKGSAGPAGGRTIMPGDPRPTPELGEPDTPSGPGGVVIRRPWLYSVLLAKGLLVRPILHAERPSRPSNYRPERFTHRAVVGP